MRLLIPIVGLRRMANIDELYFSILDYAQNNRVFTQRIDLILFQEYLDGCHDGLLIFDEDKQLGTT